MPARITPRPLCAGLLTAALALLVLPGLASAQDIRPGVYEGVWHTDKVKITIEDVPPDGTFSGRVRFDPNSRWPDYRFDFTGLVGRRGSLTITRVGDGCTQIARTDPPRRVGRSMVWCGDVAGDGLERPLPFELRIPLER
jgi:hypothetical protein